MDVLNLKSIINTKNNSHGDDLFLSSYKCITINYYNNLFNYLKFYGINY